MRRRIHVEDGSLKETMCPVGGLRSVILCSTCKREYVTSNVCHKPLILKFLPAYHVEQDECIFKGCSRKGNEWVRPLGFELSKDELDGVTQFHLVEGRKKGSRKPEIGRCIMKLPQADT